MTGGQTGKQTSQSRRPGRPPRTSTRGDILASAARLFMEKGFTTTMGDIAMAARVSKRTLYECFSNKLELYETVLTWLKEDAGGAFSAQPVEPADEVLQRYGMLLYDIYTDQRMARFMRLIEKEYERFPDLHCTTRAEFDERYTRALADYLAQAHGQPDAEAFELARGFTYWILGELATRYAEGAQDDRESFVAYIRWATGVFLQAPISRP